MAHRAGRQIFSNLPFFCQALTIGEHSFPVSILWEKPGVPIKPDAVLGAFDTTPPSPLQNSPTISDSMNYRKARDFIKRRYEEPPSKVTYEGCNYCMNTIDLSAEIPLISGAFGLYYDNILTQYALEWELKKAIIEGINDFSHLSIQNTLPLREAIEDFGNPLIVGTGRCTAITFSTLVVFKRSDGDLYTIIARRSHAVGVSPGLHHVVPAGMFEAPNIGDKWSIQENIWRELLEELYDENEQIGCGKSEIKDYIREQPPINLLIKLIDEGAAELVITGICCDLLNLRPEICTLLYVPDSTFVESRKMILNWEYENNKEIGNFAIPWKQLSGHLKYLASTGSLVPSGAACISLAQNWLRERHSI